MINSADEYYNIPHRFSFFYVQCIFNIVDFNHGCLLTNGESVLKFIAWTSAYKQENKIESFCSIRPDKAIDLARLIGKRVYNR